ncbi:MAG: hypothetical protein ABJA98_00855 [Acidobacteriota bacterium]
MRRLSCLAVLVACALCAVEPRLAAQKQGQVFISLKGADGAPVSDLGASDVSISEDGVACKTLKVEPIDWPVKLHLLVDNGKANTSPINPLRDGLTALFEQMPADVEVAMYTTSPQPRPIGKPTTDKAQLVKNIGLIAPDGGAGAFFDALFEAATRIDKDKTPNFPVIFMVGSDFGKVNMNDRDFQRLQEFIIKHAMTVHIVVMSSSSGVGSSGGGAQTEIGLAVTKLSGGRYENIATTNRLSTLLPEIGKKIAESATRQRHQFRVTYERAGNPKPGAQIALSISKPGTPTLTLDGHMP